MATTIDLTPAIRNIAIEQGQSVEIPFAITQGASPLNMTGYDVRLQVRRTLADTTTLINCTLANGKISWVSQSGGTFKLILLPTDTSGLRFKTGEDAIDAVYDLELINNTGVVFKACKGSFTINREVTR
jgi:hypothetical protein